MKKILFFFLISNFVLSQKTNDHFTTLHLSSQKTIDLIGNKEFLSKELSGKNIVLLGELSHGDGSSFTAKTKLIKYLHEHLGYHTLIFENSFFNADIFWQELNDKTDVQQLAKENIYRIWSQVKETKTLFNYIKQQKLAGTPLKVLGVDPQFSGSLNSKTFIQKLRKQLTSREIEKAEGKFDTFSYEIELMGEWLKYIPEEAHRISKMEFLGLLHYFKSILLSKFKDGSGIIWELYFDNLEAMTEIKWPSKNKNNDFDVIAFRDKKLFDNLNFHIKNHPENSKIIVWAASSHIMRNQHLIQSKYIKKRKLLGDYIYEQYPNATYSLAIASGKGQMLNFINKEIYTLDKSKRKSLEWHLRKFPDALINLEKIEKTYDLNYYKARLMGNGSILSHWSHNFDGIIYLQEMRPSTPLWD